MADVHVLVVFYSRYGHTEALALAAGLGALQANADIRLRRVADRADPDEIEADGEWAHALERMRKDYVAPRPEDAVWADVIVLATAPDRPDALLAYVADLGAVDGANGKVAAPIVPDTLLLERLCELCRAAAMHVAAQSASGVVDSATARAYSHEIVEQVRARRSGPQR